MLFNRPFRALLPQIGRQPININIDVEYYKALKWRQEAHTKNDTHNAYLFSSGSTGLDQMEDKGPLMHGIITEATAKTTEGGHIEYESQDGHS